ncbi:MAG: hypothetical protein DMG07_06835 [Acidobacteria bacterium]|nr:MAG: hypothetical protein DMG07_06835 [Acidobacteriota bacterium]
MTPEERFERIERVLDRNDEQIARHSDQLDKQLKLTAEHDAQIARHSEQLDKHAKLSAENSGQMAELRGLVLRLARLSEAQDQRWRDLNERLNALILLFEKHLSNGRH